MLEGQVGVLSAGYLSAEESVEVLDALKVSTLYRLDQNSYILYPNKQLPKFLEKNNVPSSSVSKSSLFKKLFADNNSTIIEKDILGDYHFNGNFKNADDLAIALDKLSADYQALVQNEKAFILAIFEEVFNHKEFTGRSGTFFAFEGLGSIYWHMVSKLAVAVEETSLRAIASNATTETVQKLVEHYYNISDGIGIHKSPRVYGAFPITPYSHTPLHKGAQQPGMTGQVKEDILTRLAELGIQMKDGQLGFKPQILLKQEFLQEEKAASFVLVDGSIHTIQLPKNSLAFTVCQVPVIYQLGNQETIQVTYTDGTKETFDGTTLNETISYKVFDRTGAIVCLTVTINEAVVL
jgi:Flp pilus assembly protein TadG